MIGSPNAATHGARCSLPGRPRSRMSSSSAPAGSAPPSPAQLLDQGIGVRLIEENRERARAVAEAFPKARVYNVSGLDPDFLEREHIGHAQAAVFAMRDDAKNHYVATLARIHGVTLHDRDRPRRGLPAGLPARRDRRAGRPPAGDGRGDRPLRPRPAHAAGGDARERPLRGARHHDAADERVRRPHASARCRSGER